MTPQNGTDGQGISPKQQLSEIPFQIKPQSLGVGVEGLTGEDRARETPTLRQEPLRLSAAPTGWAAVGTRRVTTSAHRWVTNRPGDARTPDPHPQKVAQGPDLP